LTASQLFASCTVGSVGSASSGALRLDDDTQIRYPLTGAHQSRLCHACHREAKVAKVTAPNELLRRAQVI
jgi:hypothetical protein